MGRSDPYVARLRAVLGPLCMNCPSDWPDRDYFLELMTAQVQPAISLIRRSPDNHAEFRSDIWF